MTEMILEKGMVISYVTESGELTYGIIVSNNVCLKHSPTFQICPLTADIKTPAFYKQYYIDVTKETMIDKAQIVSIEGVAPYRCVMEVDKLIKEHHLIGSNVSLSDCRKGDVYYANIPHEIGSIQSGERPVLIVSNDVDGQVQILPLTSQIKKIDLPTHLLVGNEDTFLLKDSIVLAEAELSIPVECLIGKLGEFTEDIMKQVDSIILIQHGITA